jgi:ABC-type polysaccharide/polyol phosphate export permease/tetratricopeptide (TPR) repeat protein
VSEADDAIEALGVGQYQRAIEILGALGAAKPNAGARLRLLWALAQLMGRNMNECVRVFLEVCERGMKGGEPAHQQLRRLVGPLESVFPPLGAQEIRLRLGDYFLRRQKPDEAIQWLQDARFAQPDDPLAIYLEAGCRFALHGDRQALREMEEIVDQAAADLDRAYFIGGRTAALWFRLGVAHDRLKNLERAARYLGKAVELSQSVEWAAENATARLLLGDVLIRLDRFEEALAELTAIPRDAHNYRYAIRLRAVALFQTGDTETALALLHEVAEIDPLGASTFLELGRIYLAIGDTLEAEIALARAFRTDPDLSELKPAIIALERVLGRTMDSDAGLPPADEFDIPEEFVLRLDDAALNQRASVRAGAASYFRVLRTLMLRDILNQQRQTGIGYLGTIVEPLVLILALDLAYHFETRQPAHGVSIEAFLTADIGTYYFFFVHMIGAVSTSVIGNANLFYFREVTPLVVIAATALRQFLTGLVAFSLMVVGLSIYENSLQVSDPLLLFAALAGIAALATIAGVCFGCGELVIPSLRFVDVFFRRLMLFCSGVFFFANDLHPQLRGWMMLNPLVHYFEFVKDYMFVSYHSRYAVWSYPLPFIFVGVFLIVVFERATRRYLVTP